MMFKEFFYLQKSDRKVIILLLIVAVVIIVLIRWSKQLPLAPESSSETFQKAKDTSVSQHSDAHKWDFSSAPSPSVHLTPFDPNTADAMQLLSLGLTEWQVKSLLKYRAKGGVFRQPADFARLYGLTQKQFKQLQPYIRISDDYRPAAELFAHQEKTTACQRDTVKFPIKLKEGAHVLLNTADTSVLKKIPGIGSYFARQIVAYRNRLGGYSSVSQLTEIDDFPSETLSFFQLSADDANRIRKLNLNKLTLNELKRHPYISFYQARAIVDYRRLHGALHSLDDLKLLNDFSEDKIRQLQPYVEF
ncbi:hypothetical protein HMPREF9151_00320 [Hoylesella saccharolytica F0055]|jgi:hypothetical protein|uniref:Competence protein ComEA helix-hairpin-helix repeat region n=1 Tax=Hoylesella saccharolytica F0055 TaxID=1127699 RepID=L1NK33_9BACT|nr:helix-hairpin-helix domain-containing protein [Hoylesella saccharolytica]EKY03547.1 hypothetical protein HMPREF9151_00320 [Hoylesella saccharolytica F0055]